MLRDRGARSIKEALAYTPGVTSSTGEGIREQFVIRGFSAISDTYVDGMRDGGNSFRDTFNLEQVEVVKGPVAGTDLCLLAAAALALLAAHKLRRRVPQEEMLEVAHV